MLVATHVASRGLDIDDRRLVINVDLPIVAQDHVHRIGRTGPAGASGVAVSVVCADGAPQLAAIEALTRQTLPGEEELGFEAEHRVPTPAPQDRSSKTEARLVDHQPTLRLQQPEKSAGS
jgi:ATP-dependent RNA helicase RhlE